MTVWYKKQTKVADVESIVTSHPFIFMILLSFGFVPANSNKLFCAPKPFALLVHACSACLRSCMRAYVRTRSGTAARAPNNRKI